MVCASKDGVDDMIDVIDVIDEWKKVITQNFAIDPINKEIKLLVCSICFEVTEKHH